MTPDQLKSRLSAYLARRTPEWSLPAREPPKPLTGGYAGSLFTIAVRSGDEPPATAVLKSYAPGARGREHAAREWHALTHLRNVGYDAPGAILFEPDDRHIGRPFIVMEHISGTTFWQALEAADPDGHARLTRSFAARLVALHDLDPSTLDPSAGAACSYGYIDEELAGIRRDGENSRRVTLTGVVRWLEENKRVAFCARPAILHRDYHPWNVLVDAAERLWVVDWDWRIGDARFDLAWACTLLRRSDLDGFGDAVREEYARRSDRCLDGLAYFEVLATTRWLLNVLPSAGSDVVLDAARHAKFQEFLVGPVRRARALVHERTGVDVDVRP